jgi:hypothetical protein
VSSPPTSPPSGWTKWRFCFAISDTRFRSVRPTVSSYTGSLRSTPRRGPHLQDGIEHAELCRDLPDDSRILERRTDLPAQLLRSRRRPRRELPVLRCRSGER